MTLLIKEQLTVIVIMIFSGMTVGLIDDIFAAALRKNKSRVIEITTQLWKYAAEGFITGEYLMYCENGKLSLTAAGSWVLGLILWKKCFYAIIATGEGYDEKGKQNSELRRKKEMRGKEKKKKKI